jgi:ribonucleoside-diphosphate reductase alpha chain
MRAEDTLETMAEKVRVATWLGILQASYTHFPYLRPAWKELCDEDRLLGVDITGQCDNPALSGDEEAMSYLNAVARSTAIIAADALGISRPAAVTCGKPSGNSSQFVDCASGFHPRYAKYYFRHVRISSKDPLFKLIRDQGVPLFPENGQEHQDADNVDVWVARFPVKAPEGAMTRNDETALEQCNRYLKIMRSWCGQKGHNQSATIYVRENEWDEVGNWLWAHFDEVVGLSFLPHDGGAYRLAPYIELSEAEYTEAQRTMPKVDFSVLSYYETRDEGQGAQELACMGGSCLI